MNPVIETIKKRRSYRQFKPDQLWQDTLDEMLMTAIHAPSANNQQPWFFTIIQKKEVIDNLSDRTKEVLKQQPNEWMQQRGNDPEFNVFYHAPTVIIVSGKEGSHYAANDCAAATENFMIAAESLNVGTVWIGLVRYLLDRDAGIANELKIPEGYKPLFGIAVGYKHQDHTPAEKKLNMDVFKYIR